EDLVAAALESTDLEARAELLRPICEAAGVVEIVPHIASWDGVRLARALVAGVYWSELPKVDESLARVRALAFDRREMALGPAPNLMFMRDPCATVYDTVVRGRMATRARLREAPLVATALRRHFGAETVIFEEDDAHRHPRYRSVEGGDVLVLSPAVVFIGCSERTTAQSIERLAYECLFPRHPGLGRIYTVLMPEARSVMHLDTILTQVDRKLFLGHAPLISGADGEPGLQVVRLTRQQPPTLVEGASPLDVLREEFGAEVQCVPC